MFVKDVLEAPVQMGKQEMIVTQNAHVLKATGAASLPVG
jgi:hypothetical protein